MLDQVGQRCPGATVMTFEVVVGFIEIHVSPCLRTTYLTITTVRASKIIEIINKEDIKSRNLPNQTSGLVVSKMANDSPLLSSVEVNSIILEAQKKKIRNQNLR